MTKRIETRSNEAGLKKISKALKGTLICLLPFAAIAVSLMIGRYPVSLTDIFNLFYLKTLNKNIGAYQTINVVVFNVRLPRIIAAAAVGTALSLSGTVYQSAFKNPMVSPGILGVSNGAGFGAAIGILLSMNFAGIQFMAFIFGIAAVGLTCFISNSLGRKSNSVLMLVLVGMVISTVFSSFISLAKYVADPEDKLPAITFWLMGSLSSVSMDEALLAIGLVAAGSVPLLLTRWKLNILTFGDEEAKALGVNASRLRFVIIACSTIITAVSISISGIIGWIGLIIPHICRMIVGPNHKILAPMSMVIGAVYLIFVDTVARSCASIEIPLGIITSLIGAPFFLFLMFNKRRAWQ